MLAVLLAFSSAETIELTSPVIRRVTLCTNDTLFIDGTGRLIYIRVNPHFVNGNLTLTLTKPHQKDNSTQLQAGERYFFYYANLTITYSDAWGPCQISVWLLTYQWCSLGIHARDQRSAEIHLDGVSSPTGSFWCYFFEFQKNPTATINISMNSSVMIGFSDSNQTLMENKSFLMESSMFVLSYQPKGGSLNAVFDTNAAFGDWADPQGVFKYCLTLDNCINFSVDADDLGLLTDRAIPVWLWLLASLLVVIIIGVIGKGLFWCPDTLALKLAAMASVQEPMLDAGSMMYT
jgi:hypothetical protein